VQAGVTYDLDPDNASILVAGGGGVALHVTRRLKNMGSWVWQLQRTDVRRKVSIQASDALLRHLPGTLLPHSIKVSWQCWKHSLPILKPWKPAGVGP
jgi:hypothetical protein